MARTVHVKKAALTETQIVETAPAPLAEGEARLRIESFSVTANNITYAVIGDMFRYWDFFPAPDGWGPDGWGIVPMWGHAVVEESRHADIAAGERVYGYLPMGTHLVVQPGQISPAGFTDMAAHRQPMSPFYNQYARLAADPEHDPAHEAERMIFGPLFKTGFLIEAMFNREHWFGADTLILTSASSKTAMALAHCAREASPAIRRVGLTSAANTGFVEASGLYDQVLAYDQLAELEARASVAVDFAGNASLLRGIHEQLGDDLRYSCLVGATHVAERGGDGTPLPGPAPILFFAPTEAVALIKAMGPAGFAQAVAERWKSFLTVTGAIVRIDVREGMEAAKDAYLTTLAGKADPAVGIVVRG